MKELKDIPKTNPYKVPENYFEELGTRLLAVTTGSEQVKEVPEKGRVRRLLPYLAAAASLALLLTIGYTLFNNGRTGKGGEQLPVISATDLSESYLSDIDLSILEEKVAESGVLNARSGISKGDIIDYLVDENINVLEIIENL